MTKPNAPLDPPSLEPVDQDVDEQLEQRVDDALDGTFPASDPVAFMTQADGDYDDEPLDPLTPPPSRTPDA